MSARVPFNRPCLTGKETEYMLKAVAAGHLSGGGAFTRKVEELLQQQLGVRRVVLTTSCTHALEMSAMLLDLGPEDDVLVPSFTFVSTINAFYLRGARPVFVDVRPDTLNIDERLLESRLTARTRAVWPVHYAGVGCDMGAIGAFAERHGLSVVEDNAHGLYGTLKGRFLGTFGALSTLSFHETKNFTCGEGGALVINDGRYVERAEVLRDKGTNRSRFFRGQVDKYTWVDIGSSYPPADMLAAFLLAQLEQRETVMAKRQRLWGRYAEALAGWASRQDVRLPVVPADAGQAFHMFYLLLPSLEARQRFIAHLKERDVMSVFHYVPLHLSDVGRRLGGREGLCPVTERISDQLVRLPFFNDLSDDEQGRVVEAVLSFEV